MWRQPKPEPVHRVKRIQPERFVTCPRCGELRPATVTTCAA